MLETTLRTSIAPLLAGAALALLPAPAASDDSMRYHQKEQVIGLELDGRAKAYPFAEMSKHDTPFADRVAGRTVTVHFDSANRTGRVLDEDGSEIPTVIAYWFAWAAFHPDTAVFEAP